MGSGCVPIVVGRFEPWATSKVKKAKPTLARHSRGSKRESRLAYRSLMKFPCVYILANKPNGTLYIGVTSDLVSRCWQHRQAVVKGFSKSYGVKQLVYYEMHQTMTEAIYREKQLKKWNRAWKIDLIEKGNPHWRDLWQEII